MQSSSVCDPNRSSLLSRIVCAPHGNGVTIVGGVAAAAGALSAFILTRNGGFAKTMGTLGLLGTAAFVAAASPEVSAWVNKTKDGMQGKVQEMRDERAARKAANAEGQMAEAGYPTAVPRPDDAVVIGSANGARPAGPGVSSFDA